MISYEKVLEATYKILSNETTEIGEKEWKSKNRESLTLANAHQKKWTKKKRNGTTQENELYNNNNDNNNK